MTNKTCSKHDPIYVPIMNKKESEYDQEIPQSHPQHLRTMTITRNEEGKQNTLKTIARVSNLLPEISWNWTNLATVSKKVIIGKFFEGSRRIKNTIN